jgi:hypothetical protein
MTDLCSPFSERIRWLPTVPYDMWDGLRLWVSDLSRYLLGMGRVYHSGSLALGKEPNTFTNEAFLTRSIRARLTLASLTLPSMSR